MIIDTEITPGVVEIEGREYAVAERTVETIEKLMEAVRQNTGKPVYRQWRAELEILLGKEACRELFSAGQKENIDRMQIIYEGVAKEFNRTADRMASSDYEEKAQQVTETIAPLNELLRQARSIIQANKGQQRPEIARP